MRVLQVVGGGPLFVGSEGQGFLGGGSGSRAQGFVGLSVKQAFLRVNAC